MLSSLARSAFASHVANSLLDVFASYLAWIARSHIAFISVLAHVFFIR